MREIEEFELAMEEIFQVVLKQKPEIIDAFEGMLKRASEKENTNEQQTSVE